MKRELIAIPLMLGLATTIGACQPAGDDLNTPPADEPLPGETTPTTPGEVSPTTPGEVPPTTPGEQTSGVKSGERLKGNSLSPLKIMERRNRQKDTFTLELFLTIDIAGSHDEIGRIDVEHLS